jgi:hypothetical protein
MKHYLLCLVVAFALSAATIAGQQSIVPNSSAIFSLTENYLLMGDMGGDRVVRVNDFTSTGWEQGPSLTGLSIRSPWHISLDSSGRLYIADRDNNRLVRMDDIAGNGWKAFSGIGSNVLGTFVNTGISGGYGSDGIYVSSAAVDSAGRIYITSGPRLVRVNDMDGGGWTLYTPPNTSGSNGNKRVAFDTQGRIYVTDNGNHRIVRFNDMQGTGFTSLGSFGNGVNQFNEPEGMTFDTLGRIYIIDESNHRLIRMNDMTGAGWTTFGTYGSGVGQLSIPHDVQIDTVGRIYIADTGNGRIVRINSMNGDGWVEFGERGCISCTPPDLGPFKVVSPKGLIVLGRGPNLPYSGTFPQVAVGGNYRTSIIGLNTGTTTVNGDFSFSKTSLDPSGRPSPPFPGSPLPVTVDNETNTSFSRAVVPMGVVRLDATSSSSVVAGFASLRSAEELKGIALFQTFSGDTITSEASVSLGSPTNRVRIYIDNTNNAQTGYAIASPIPDWIASQGQAVTSQYYKAVALKLRDKNGTLLGTESVNIGPGGHVAEFVSQRFPGLAGPSFEGTLELNTGDNSGSRNVSAVALRYDNAEQDVFTTIPVTPVAGDPNVDATITKAHVGIPRIEATTLYYPQVADGGTYRTNFIIVNAHDKPITATLEFFADDGTPLSLPIGGTLRSSQAISLAANGATRIVTDGTASTIKSGWARVTTPPTASYAPLIGGAAIFQTVIDGRITSEAGVLASPRASRFTTYIDTRGFADSGVAISNPNNSNVNVTLNLRHASGQIVASSTRNLVALGHTAQMLSQLFPSFDEFEGTLEVVTTGTPVSGVALRYDNPGGTVFATTPISVIP